MKTVSAVILFAVAHSSIGLSTDKSFSSTVANTMGQAISSSQFFVYGKRHFTQTGYLRHVKEYKSPVQEAAAIGVGADGADGVDLDNKVVLVTGANSGLGKEIATYAAAKNAKVYMLCRTKSRAEAARDEIVKETSNEKVKIILADVGELAQVKRAAEELQSQEDEVYCIVCNAGALLNERKETSEGNEVTFASHLLGGSYLLPQLLMPQLKAAGSESRVVYVSSGGMYNTKWPKWSVATSSGESKNDYSGLMAYSYAKRGQVLLAERFTKEYPEVAFVSGHPGWATTPGVDDTFGEDQKYLKPLRTTWQGAEGLAWLMAAERKNLKSGAFYLDRSEAKKHRGGLFMSEGSFTKNTEAEVDQMMADLKKACGSFIEK